MRQSEKACQRNFRNQRGGVSVIRYIRESLCTFFFLNLGVGRIDPIFSDLCMIWANTYPTKAINE